MCLFWEKTQLMSYCYTLHFIHNHGKYILIIYYILYIYIFNVSMHIRCLMIHTHNCNIWLLNEACPRGSRQNGARSTRLSLMHIRSKWADVWKSFHHISKNMYALVRSFHNVLWSLENCLSKQRLKLQHFFQLHFAMNICIWRCNCKNRA